MISLIFLMVFAGVFLGIVMAVVDPNCHIRNF